MVPKLTDEPGVTALAAMIARGALSPLEAVDAAIARIEALDGAINAVVVRDFDRSRDRAKSLTATGPQGDQPLFGVPMTIKESFDVDGLPTTWGLPACSDYVAPRDAAVVRRLKRAGAVLLGKTNVPPYLADWQSANEVYGRTVNPHDAGRTPGGSSGGAAAALATGMVPAEYGSDIGGSIRVPSHFSGVWGHKTTWGVVTSQGQEFPGTDGHDIALGVVGPMARNGEDLALLLDVTLDRPLVRRECAIGGARFLYLEDHPLCPVDDAVRAPIEAVVEALEAAGAAVDRRSALLPDMAEQHDTYMRMLQIALFKGAPGPQGQVASAADWFALCDAQARNQRAWAALFNSYDFVLMAPSAVPAFRHDDTPMPQRTLLVNGAAVSVDAVLAYAGTATFPGLPATVLPVGAAGHLPVGMQVIGPSHADRGCIAMAIAIGQLLR
ncbi:amidase family protein [Novosphingobium sp. UBA1939]|uniref:amidase family protein n=1 Tax=Novosphingobium sp. UBA1939 TaxID=1946982 RepID=UPI0025F69E92|nr:amidase family protein [Novosphingobium sp. UBA1939]